MSPASIIPSVGEESGASATFALLLELSASAMFHNRLSSLDFTFDHQFVQVPYTSSGPTDWTKLAGFTDSICCTKDNPLSNCETSGANDFIEITGAAEPPVQNVFKASYLFPLETREQKLSDFDPRWATATVSVAAGLALLDRLSLCPPTHTGSNKQRDK